MLAGIGSAGMNAQADSVISIDAKRGDSCGRLLVGGNHAPDSVIPFTFEDGIFLLDEKELTGDRLTRDEEATVAALTDHPEGCTTAAVALAMGKSEEAARKSLGRLQARGMVIRPKRGLYLLSNGQTDNSGQFRNCPKGQPDRTGHTLIESVSSLSVPVRSGGPLRGGGSPPLPRGDAMNRKERRAARVPRYTEKMLDALQGRQLTPGLHIVRILHDDWCASLDGRGPCNCDPEIRLPAGLQGEN